MSAVILAFPIKRQQRADGAGAAVAIAAARMGYRPHLAARAARLTRRDVMEGHKSAARAVSDMKAVLSLAARAPSGGAA